MSMHTRAGRPGAAHTGNIPCFTLGYPISSSTKPSLWLSLSLPYFSEDEAVGGLNDSARKATENLVAATWVLHPISCAYLQSSIVYEMRGYKSTVVLSSSALQPYAMHRS
jgi:hypothetical protein